MNRCIRSRLKAGWVAMLLLAIGAVRPMEAWAGLILIDQPASPQRLKEGGRLFLNITADGPGVIFYTWIKDGVAKPPSTGNSYIVAAVKASDAGIYRCRLTAGTDTVFTDAITVEVEEDIHLWTRSMNLAVNTTSAGANVAGDIADFPLLIRLDASRFDFTTAAADGRDLRFLAADQTPLAYEIARWRPDLKEAEIWVKLKTVKGNSVNSLTLNWGRADAVARSSGSSVFAAAEGWRGAWHMDEESGTAAADASGNGRKGTVAGAEVNAAGLSGKGYRFAGGSNHVALPTELSSGLRSFTILMWAKETQSVNCDVNWMCPTLTGFQLSGNGADDLWLFSKTGKLGLSHGLWTVPFSESEDNSFLSSIPLNDGKWHHVALSWDGARLTLSEAGKALQALEAGGGPLGALGFDIGNWHLVDGQRGHGFRGDMDEYQFTSRAQSADWIKLAYETQRTDAKAITFGQATAPKTPTQAPVLLPGAKDTLAAGDTVALPGSFLLNSLPGNPSITVENLPLPGALAGFERTGPMIRVGGPAPGAVIAGVAVPGAAQEGLSLFRIEADGSTVRIAHKSGVLVMTSPGDWFWGADSRPPAIAWLGSKPVGKDSLRVSFRVADNVANLEWTLRWRTGADSSAWAPIRSGDTAARNLPVPVSETEPVEIRFTVSDGTLASRLPSAEDRVFTVGRPLPAASPIALGGGGAWVLAGLPAGADAGLLLRDIAGANSEGGAVHAAVWKDNPSVPGTGTYRVLATGEKLPKGQAAWLASDMPLASLSLPGIRSLDSDSDGAFPIRLGPGWNLVANPTLRPLAWPMSRKDVDAYALSQVKGLHAQSGESYAPTDTLVPWKGYYVFNHGAETVIRVGGQASPGSVAPPPAGGSPIAKSATAASRAPSLDLVVSDGAGASVRLGIRTWASESVGREDDPSPPPRSGPRRGLWSRREGKALAVDFIPSRPGQAASWTLVASGDGKPGAARLFLPTRSLPEGDQVWAAFPSRRLRIRVDDQPSFPVAEEDTVILYSGSPSALTGLPALEGLTAAPVALRHGFRTGPMGLQVLLALPTAARVSLRIHRLDGTCLGAWSSRPAQAGWHTWEMPLAGTGGPASSGVLFAELIVFGEQGLVRIVEKISLFAFQPGFKAGFTP